MTGSEQIMPVQAAVITLGCSMSPEVINAGGKGASMVPGFQVCLGICMVLWLVLWLICAEYSRKFANVKGKMSKKGAGDGNE